jgi:hypothetical protein
MGDIKPAASGDRRVARQLRLVIDLATAELRRLGATEEEIQAFLRRKRSQLALA